MAAADVREVFTEARVLLSSVRNPGTSRMHMNSPSRGPS